MQQDGLQSNGWPRSDVRLVLDYHGSTVSVRSDFVAAPQGSVTRPFSYSPRPSGGTSAAVAVQTATRGDRKNMLLTDIAVEHTVVSKKDGVRQTFLLHPFTDTQRDSLGKFELVRDVSQPGFKDVKRSTFVSFHQLAELYAKGLLDEFGFSVRMCPAKGTYPAKLPAKKILPTSIKPGSSFDLAVQKVDISKPATRELRTALLRTNVQI